MTSTKSPLIIRHNYVYNPTNEWCQCSVRGDEQSYRIDVIPPRSSRTFPADIPNPEIINFRNLRPDQINSYEINQEAIVLEPIDVTFDAEWKGIIRSNNVEKTISASLMIKTTKLSGIIIYESINYLIRGTINTKSRGISCSMYNLDQREEIKLTGRIDNYNEDPEYTITLDNNNYNIILNVESSNKTTFKKDSIITGKYMAFYTRGQNQNEMTLQLESYEHGILNGNGNENESFEVLGYADKGKDFYLVRFGSDTTYYTGTISATKSEVYIEGTYHNRDSGQFTFFKEM